ncbi:MAG TPA: cupin domain-containing protein [Lacunisphaera sp.]|nr:cupin domain-containing protein [Lacunisphaera sp.]
MPAALLSADQAGVCSLQMPTSPVAHGIISQAVVTAPGLRVTLFRFAAGQELSEHTTPARALVQVLAGTCEFTLPGRGQRLVAGDLLHLPPGLPHAVRALEDLTLLITQATPPPAADSTRP